MSSAGKSILDQILAQDSAAASTGVRLSVQSGDPVTENRPPERCSSALAVQIEAEVVDLFRQNAAALSRYAAALTRDKEAVRDGVQEAFLRYFAARTRGQHMENPRAWLFTVLRNYILDRHRRSATCAEVELTCAEQLADRSPNQETRYETTEISRRILENLSPREQECMRLRLEGLGYDEIAQVLRIRSGTVGALLARGVKKIRSSGLLHRRE